MLGPENQATLERTVAVLTAVRNYGPENRSAIVEMWVEMNEAQKMALVGCLASAFDGVLNALAKANGADPERTFQAFALRFVQ